MADLAGRGWAVWNLEFRRMGSDGGWPATFEDVAAGIDHLAHLNEPLDLDRVVAIGHSAGGHLALWVAAEHTHVRVSGVVAQAAVADLREAARLNLSGGAVDELLGASGRYELASPAERPPLGIPHLLVHGDADDVVPIDIARRYARRAAENGDACALIELAGVGHMEHLDPASKAWRPVTAWLEER